MRVQPWMLLLAGIGFAQAFADTDRVEHFQGKQANTVEEALQNLTEYNQRFQALMTQPITQEISYEVHQLTYTLENALSFLEDELELAKDHLERLHLASETHQVDQMTQEGARYLELTGRLFSQPRDAEHP